MAFNTLATSCTACLHFAFLFIWICFITFTQAAFRLPSTITPSRYILQLTPNISKATYTGTVKIIVQTSADVPQGSLTSISLHKGISVVVEYSSVTITSTTTNQTITLTNTFYEFDTQVYTLYLQSAMTAGTSYIIAMSFSGTLRKDDIGLHIGSYNKISYVAANFYPIHARLAFPCFDEPQLKAVFEVTITRSSSQFAVSNQKLLAQNDVTEGVQDVFLETPEMSTHSLSIFVGDNETMEMLEVEAETGTTLKLWKPKQMDTVISFDVVPFNSFTTFQSLVEQLFQKPHPLKILNFFVLPNLQYDVFGGYGMIFFKGNVVEPYQGFSLQQNIKTYLIVLEQMIKQYFCNYLTPEWWSDVWLTEGVTTYFKYLMFSYLISEESMLHPDQMLAVSIRQEALSLEDFESHPLVESDIKSSNDILRTSWDELKKYKGAAVYYMMDESTSGLPTKTLVKDILSNQNQSTISTLHFLQMIFSNNTSISYKDFLVSWFNTAGYPIVELSRSGSAFELTQFKQNAIGLTNISTSTSPWKIPITYTSLSKPDTKWMKMTPKFWLNYNTLNSRTSALLSEWMIFNIKSSGFYRVLYEVSDLELIQSQLTTDNSRIDPINHAALVDDIMSMAATGNHDYNTTLSFLLKTSMHSRYSPWISSINKLSFLKLSLYNQPEYNTFKDFVKQLIQYPYNVVGFVGDTQEPNNVTLLRNLILPWACEFDVGDCVASATTIMEILGSSNLKSTKSYLNVDDNMCTAFRKINTSMFESFLTLYKGNDLQPAYKYYIASGFGCVTGDKLNTILEALLTGEIYTEDVETVLVRSYSVIENVDTMVNFIVDNATYIQEKYGKHLLIKVIKGIGGTIYSQAQLSKLSSLNSTDSLISSTVTYTKSTAKSRLSWISANRLRLTSGLNTVMSKSSAVFMKYNVLLLIVILVTNFSKLIIFDV